MKHTILDVFNIAIPLFTNTILLHEKGHIEPFAAIAVSNGISTLSVGSVLPKNGHHVELDD